MTQRLYAEQATNNQNKKLIEQNIAGMFNLIITIQEKIEKLKIKLCGFSKFSPAVYFSYIDKGLKGYITTSDMTSFIKKFVNNFNTDQRHLRMMFNKFNNDDNPERVRMGNLSYFGYLNMIKPYFSPQAASELLNRDQMSSNPQINEQALQIFHQLIRLIYVLVAEHEEIKEALSEEYLMNGQQYMELVKETRQNRNKQSAQNDILVSSREKGYNFISEQVLGFREKLVPSQKKIQSENIIGKRKNSQNDYLASFWRLIHQNGFQVAEGSTKNILAYLQCHEYLLGTEKYLNILFMPMNSDFIVNFNSQQQDQTHFKTLPTIEKPVNQTTYRGGANFLTYIHPNSVRVQHQFKQQPKKNVPRNPEDVYRTHQVLSPYQTNDINTPFLQKFLRESNVAKNMSIKRSQVNQNSRYLINESSAFIQSSNFGPDELLGKYQKKKGDILLNNSSRPIKQSAHDFNLRKIEESESMHVSEMMRDQRKPTIKNLKPIQQDFEGSGSFLGQFMIK